MYRRLAPLLGKFIAIETVEGARNPSYEGRLMEVTPEYFEIQTFEEDGSLAGLWVGLIQNIVAVKIDSPLLREMSLEVKYKNSPDEPVPANA